METMNKSIPKVEWDYEGIHYFDNGPLTVQYLFVLDALNFCFWPGTFLFFSYIKSLIMLSLSSGNSSESSLNFLLYLSANFMTYDYRLYMYKVGHNA